MQRLRNIVIVNVCAAAALTACMDASAGLDPEVADRDNAALETEAAEAAESAACPTFAGTWQNDESAFAAAIAPATRIDFTRRANGAAPAAGVIVPGDEYLACCGIRLDYVGDAGGRLIWVGNSESGFAIKGKCKAPDECFSPSGIRVTFVPATTAAGGVRGGFQTASMRDAQDAEISKMPPTTSFLGYQSAVPIAHAEFRHVFSGARLVRLVYRRCL